jgi:hypothetical protein
MRLQGAIPAPRSGPASIDVDRLMAFRIPEAWQELTARDIGFYALSIGMGRDPNNVDQLRFVDSL